jgi:hypothetical protein
LNRQSITSACHLAAAHGDTPDADSAVGVARVEGVTVSGPAEGEAAHGERLLGGRGHVLGGKVIHEILGLKVPDLDRLGGGGAEPVPVGREDEGVDGVAGVERVEVLALLEIPEHGGAVLATRGAEGTVGGDGHAVEVAGVAHKVGPELAAREVPHLDQLVPTARDDEGVLGGGREADAGNPLAVTILGAGGADGVLAVTKGVPQLDGLLRNRIIIIRIPQQGKI